MYIMHFISKTILLRETKQRECLWLACKCSGRTWCPGGPGAARCTQGCARRRPGELQVLVSQRAYPWKSVSLSGTSLRTSSSPDTASTHTRHGWNGFSPRPVWSRSIQRHFVSQLPFAPRYAAFQRVLVC